MSLLGPDVLIRLQQPAVVDTVARGDSIVVKSPLPGGAAAVVCFLFATRPPSWQHLAPSGGAP
jgi:hypothetical protein